MIFEENKEKDTEYYLNKLNMSLFIKIQTKLIEKKDKYLKIHYQITDSSQEFIYFLEMSDNK